MLAFGHEPIHTDADVVFFCKGANVLEDEGINITVEHVAFYKENKMAFVKLNGKEEQIRKIDIEMQNDISSYLV